MNILESLRVAIRGLSTNKMRTALTMLGIIIGVGVVILVVAIGQGAAQRVTDTVNSLGTNLLTIFPQRVHARIVAAVNLAETNGTAKDTNSANKLTMDDAKIMAADFPKSIDAVAPTVRSNVQIVYGNINSSTNITGATVDYPYVNNFSMDRGQYFSQADVDGSHKVCVIGTTVVTKLTNDPNADLLGKVISVNRVNFTVIGILTPKGATSWGQDQDDVIICPITTAMRRLLNKLSVDMISVRCTTPDMEDLATEEISNLLRTRHHLTPPFPDNDDFQIRSQTELMERQQSVTSTMTSLLSIVAVISLVVGGIGIMNIMLVSVTERTREIGIRKAIGATPHDIMMQFLIESSIISLLGGIVGIGVGVGGAHLLATVGGWNTIVSTTSVVAAVVVSAGVGLFFGIYPASKAAALHPIEALRYE